MSEAQREFKWVFHERVLLCREAPGLDDDVVTHWELWEELAKSMDTQADVLSRNGVSGLLFLNGERYVYEASEDAVLPADFEKYLEAFLRQECEIAEPTAEDEGEEWRLT